MSRIVCPNCREEVDASFIYCPVCGTKLTGATLSHDSKSYVNITYTRMYCNLITRIYEFVDVYYDNKLIGQIKPGDTLRFSTPLPGKVILRKYSVCGPVDFEIANNQVLNIVIDQYPSFKIYRELRIRKVERIDL